MGDHLARRNSRNLHGIEGGTAAQWHKTWSVHHGAWPWARPWAWSRPHWRVEEPVVTGCDKEKLHLRHGTTETQPLKNGALWWSLRHLGLAVPPAAAIITYSISHSFLFNVIYSHLFSGSWFRTGGNIGPCCQGAMPELI